MPRRESASKLIGRRIRSRRAFLEMSQIELAARLQVHQNSVSNWEKGRQALTIDRLLELAEVLQVSPADLLADDDTVPVA